MSHYTSTSITTTTPSIPVPFPVPSALSLLYCTALHLKLLIDYHIIYKCCFLLLFLLPTLSFSFYIIHLLLLFLYYIMLPFNLEIFFFILVVILLLTDRLTDWLIVWFIVWSFPEWVNERVSPHTPYKQCTRTYIINLRIFEYIWFFSFYRIFCFCLLWNFSLSNIDIQRS